MGVQDEDRTNASVLFLLPLVIFPSSSSSSSSSSSASFSCVADRIILVGSFYGVALLGRDERQLELAVHLVKGQRRRRAATTDRGKHAHWQTCKAIGRSWQYQFRPRAASTRSSSSAAQTLAASGCSSCNAESTPARMRSALKYTWAS